MPMSSKFLTESTGEKIVKIGQYLAKIWTKYDSLLFLGHPVCYVIISYFYSISCRTVNLVTAIGCVHIAESVGSRRDRAI